MATIQGVYVALFGRPADPAGLEYFNEATGEGADLTAIGDLAATAEYQTRFAGQNNVQIVTSIYQSLFNRTPEAAGLEFFVAALQNGTLNINNIAIAILDGAQGDDLAILNNKLAAANLFTTSLNTAIEIETYKGDEAAASGRAFLSEVSTTVPTQEAVDAAIAAIGEGSSNEGIFDLSAGTDTATTVGSVVSGIATDFKFTANNQIVNGTANTTFTAADTLTDGSTTDADVFNLAASGTGLAGATGIITNIETIKVVAGTTNATELTASNFNLSNVTGLKTLTFAGRINAGDTVNVQNLGDTGVTTIDISALTGESVASVITFNDTTANQDVTFVGSAISTQVSLGDGDNTITTGAGADTIIVGAGNNTIVAGNGTNAITVNLSADADYDGDNDGTNTITGGVGVDTVTINAHGNNTIDVGNGINSVTINGNGNNTITSGTAADTVTLTGNGDNTVTTGAGNDTITVSGDGDNTITAGKGVDSIDLTGSTGDNALVFAAGDLGLNADGDADVTFVDTIVGFNDATDTITFGLGTAATGVNFATADVTGAATVTAALADADAIAAFDGSNMYVFAFNATDGWLFVDADLDGTADYGVFLDNLTTFDPNAII